MYYNLFKDKKLSGLGFGTMRLPILCDGSIDELQLQEMVDYAMSHGVNYFDSAYAYHDSNAERAIGKALKKYDRGSYYLATKFPAHQIMSNYDPAPIFEEQLEKCSVDYFDFYLLHNVYENSVATYLDPKWGIIDYLKEQKRIGRIKHLGFSSHARLENLRSFLDICGDDMEFCQIQLNYMDWTLQNAKEKYELLTERGIPVWVMEPVRGGKLAKLNDRDEAKLRELSSDKNAPSWAFRFLQRLPNVTMILSGMSNMEQMVDNINTFSIRQPLSANETEVLLEIAEGMKDSIPCTACRYCCSGCPMGLNIPNLLASYNDIRFDPNINSAMEIQALPINKQPSACIGCGKCARVCPQHIDIPNELKNFTVALSKIPSWAEICRQREEAAIKSRK